MKTFKGSCHCQAVQFEIDTDLSELTTCDCSICVKKNALMIKVHETSMRILSGKNPLLLINSILILQSIIFVTLVVFIHFIVNV